MAKNLSTKSRRSVNEISAKDFSSPATFFFAESSSTKNFNFILIFSAKTHFFRIF